MKKTGFLSYSDAIENIKKALKCEGFGVLTEIDVKQTFKKKLDKDFTDYNILGACNPNLAFEALINEFDIGLLPCNIVVYVDPTERRTIVTAIDPVEMVKVTGRSDLDAFAESVRDKLTRALESIA